MNSAFTIATRREYIHAGDGRAGKHRIYVFRVNGTAVNTGEIP